MSGVIRLIIVHDRSILSQGLSMLLSAEPDLKVVGEAFDETAAAVLAAEAAPQVALVDADMCQARGLAAARAVSATCPNVGVIMLSLYDDPETRASAMQAGASSFVSKQAPARMLQEIRSFGRRS